MENDFQNDDQKKFLDLKEWTRNQLNSLSHQAFLIRSQLGDLCRLHKVQTTTFQTTYSMNIHQDLDFSTFDTQGVDKRIVIRLADTPVPDSVRRTMKQYTRKLSVIYHEQAGIVNQLAQELDYEPAKYNVDEGWTFKPCKKSWHSTEDALKKKILNL